MTASALIRVIAKCQRPSGQPAYVGEALAERRSVPILLLIRGEKLGDPVGSRGGAEKWLRWTGQRVWEGERPARSGVRVRVIGNGNGNGYGYGERTEGLSVLVSSRDG